MDYNNKKKLKNILKAFNKIFRYFEISFKLITYPLLNFLFHNSTLTNKINPNKVKRILFIRHDFVGDMIITLPCFKFIKTLNPNIIVDVYCSKNNHFILEGDKNVDNVFIQKKSIIEFILQVIKIRNNNYDIVINTLCTQMTKNGFLTNLLSKPNTIKTVVAVGEKYKIFYNKMSYLAKEEKVMWKTMLYLVYDIFDTNLNPLDFKPYISINDTSKINAIKKLNQLGISNINETNNDKEIEKLKDLIGINLSARREENYWLTNSYVELIELIINNYPNVKIILFYVQNDIDKVNEILSKLSVNTKNNVMVYPESKDIKEVAYALSKTKLAISPDTGFIHLITSVRVPVLALYRGEGLNTINWKPYANSYLLIEAGESREVRDISAKFVFENFNILFNNLQNQKEYFCKIVTQP